MDLKEAFYKQKEELRAVKRELQTTQKKLERFQKDLASNETFKKQFSHIKGLNLKVSELTRLLERYKTLYEQGKDQYAKLIERFSHLEYENRQLQWEIDCLKGRKTVDGTTAAEEATAKIEALSNEVAKLTAIIDRDGTTAGIPTSKTPINKNKVIPNSREKTEKSKGGQPGHKKHTLEPFSDLSDVEPVEHPLAHCPLCGSDDLEEIGTIDKDELDYEVRVVKKRHHFKKCRCKCCGKIVRSKDSALKADNQYGPVIQAMALASMDLGFVSINRTRSLLRGITDVSLPLSEGYLSKLQKRYADKLTDFCEEVRTACIASPLIYWDDTVVFINTVRACMRFYGNDKLALYTAHLKKNLPGVLEDKLLQCLPPTTKVMHDHNTINYNAQFIFQNVECLQHLERDLKKVYDSSGHQWAAQMKELITSTIHKRKQLIENNIFEFDQSTITLFMTKFDGLLASGYKEYFRECNRYFSQFENALLLRLEGYKENYTAWVEDFSVPTTNNLSERSLRYIKIKDKVSGQFQNEAHAQYFARIRTYIETCRRNGINEFQAILRLTSGSPYTLQELYSQSGA